MINYIDANPQFQYHTGPIKSPPSDIRIYDEDLVVSIPHWSN